MALTAQNLDRILEEGCEECQKSGAKHPHEELVLSSRCHPGKGTDAAYNQGGTLKICCHVCKAPIAEIVVAPGTTT